MKYHPSLFCCWTKLCRDVACWCGSGGGWSCEMEAMPDVIALIVDGKNLDLKSDLLSDVNASVLVNFALLLEQQYKWNCVSGSAQKGQFGE